MNRGRYASPKPIDYFELCGVARPKPLPDFDIAKARPRPYRPFRWPYHQTMGVMNMDPDYFIELESTYKSRVAQRLSIHRTQQTKVLNATPGAELACTELMEIVIQFLCVRYPNLFTFDHRTGAFYNGILQREFDTRTMHPLRVLIENVPEDFLIMLYNEKTGFYHLRAGVAISAIGWNLGEKLDKSMPEIHVPVPDYKAKIENSVNRFFNKLTADKPIQRGSWGFEVGEQLFLQTDSPHWAERLNQNPSLTPADIYLRVDWQTLRRLPRSKAIVFNFKALFTPLTQLRTEPRIPRLLAMILRHSQENIMKYKGTWHAEHVLIPAFESWAEEQEREIGVQEGGVRTLDEHPFYPGWNSK
ncbi:hypothetical protein BDN70DRAFT_854514 [Pholiota conissans]|uniref:Uncharacterized protein n=1 Tax=Pholiota conissans TaxID=109636 RepID=A0A9P6CWE4_9AGAR|nr:hypothetical protein BDN70DRAFT_854514 [Pholiota conissans]